MPGDTLYSVAWESGRDYRQIARWNHLQPPYVLFVGERLRLTPPPAPPPVPAVAAPLSIASAAPVGHPLLPAPVRQGAAVARAAPPPKVRAAGGKVRVQPVRSWIWPAAGRIISVYGGPSGNRGIDIAGNYGEPVRAAAGGRVVYVGSGLPGYGRLIIIKDNNDYLSAYAHNARLYVQEGGVVRQGQTIATMGNSGTDHVELHFEIRRHGNPVDPLLLLPGNHH
ncbi:MAG: peptidoglycan DD-metalloendopeptidase family protein [Gammaproteobacteria bacterium]|nr:peptidoglycan DD-metalloendopeptidase family protein [Gammaproteobacteria bacterium]